VLWLASRNCQRPGAASRAAADARTRDDFLRQDTACGTRGIASGRGRQPAGPRHPFVRTRPRRARAALPQSRSIVARLQRTSTPAGTTAVAAVARKDEVPRDLQYQPRRVLSSTRRWSEDADRRGARARPWGSTALESSARTSATA